MSIVRANTPKCMRGHNQHTPRAVKSNYKLYYSITPFFVPCNAKIAAFGLEYYCKRYQSNTYFAR